eukprot:CAMPEP_0119572008 /NCGR_PEP_ID=MMETSP1352-20130426/44404_1 /TAXON_ID=265584 /ORGANISM="Stauroneis constricta, Strain CCMP1120" /LENGTH=431 /DNA_ID=CAMNT_0007621691 /DNA_START=91 /DNA_END=1386 /DNA_ORIENTATION=-
MVAPARPTNTLSIQEESQLANFKLQAKALIVICFLCIGSYVYHGNKRAATADAPPIDISIDTIGGNANTDTNADIDAEPDTMMYPYEELRQKAKRVFALHPDNEFVPKIAWLMSFPNSGTSFTMILTARLTERAIASNYGEEVTTREMGDTLSIYPRRPEGPFWSGMSGLLTTPRPLPDTYVLTKTHCGSRCMDCPPREYVETAESFLRRCASGYRRKMFGGDKQNWRRIDVEYPSERVHKAIHLIRNPMHNAIARFHLDYRNRQKSHSADIRAFTKKYKQDKRGFRAWCRDLDGRYASENERYFSSSRSSSQSQSAVSWDVMKDVPCHTEFFKWTQWHNLAHESIGLIEKEHHEVPVLTVYYEDYVSRYNETVDSIVDFLEQEKVGTLRDFQVRSNYDGYYDSEHVGQIRAMVEAISNDSTWEKVKHYFG